MTFTSKVVDQILQRVVASAPTASRDCSPAVETRAAQITSESLALALINLDCHILAELNRDGVLLRYRGSVLHS
jgi:hypothetical protein